MSQPCMVCGSSGRSRIDGVWYCSIHYDRLRKYGRINSVRKPSTVRVDGNTATITTPTGYRFTIDSIDAGMAAQHHWRETHGYAITRLPNRTNMPLHRMILGNDNIPKGMVVDHIDGDPSNNKRSNLRICTRIQNSRNHKKYPGANEHEGVRRKRSGRYEAYISVHDTQQYLGTFDDIQSAVRARAEAEIGVFGDFRRMCGINVRSEVQA